MASLNEAIEELLVNEVRVDPVEANTYLHFFNTFLNKLKSCFLSEGFMREFPSLKFELKGSASLGLRIGHFDEFDVHLVLKDFSRLTKSLQILNANGFPGCVYFQKIQSNQHRGPFIYNPAYNPDNEDWWQVYSALGMFFDREGERNGVIMPSKVRNVVLEAVRRAIPQMDYEIKDIKQQGPAVKIVVREGNTRISIDLVPVFRLPMSELPKAMMVGRNLSLYSREHDEAKWSIIPKSHPLDHDQFTWTADFSELKKEVYYRRDHMKDGVRLMKWLRNRENGGDPRSNPTTGPWFQLNSYIIETLFLWKDVEVRNHEPEFWMMANGTILVKMIELLIRKLRARKISDFWCPEFNLLTRREVNCEHWKNMANRLQRIVDALQGPNPAEAVEKYLGGGS